MTRSQAMRPGGNGLSVFLASVGSALEFYDFVIFVFLTGVIGKLFFPPSLPDWNRQLVTYAIFAAGYLVRPIGGVVLAHFGDLHGRRGIFKVTLFLMAIPTILIGLLPTYGSIGVAAPLLLLLMRLCQGLSIGGEAPGAWVFVAEHATKGGRGYAIGLLTCGLSAGILLASTVTFGLNVAFTPVQMLAYAWRLPFLLGGVLGLGAALRRRWLVETPEFQQLAETRRLNVTFPLRLLFERFKTAVGLSIACTLLLTAAILVVILMTPSLLQTSFGIGLRASQGANLAGSAALCVSCVVLGLAADRFGVRRTAAVSTPVLAIATYLLYWGARHAPALLVPLYALAGFGAGTVVLVPICMVMAFPAQVRFTGVSFSYNLGYAVFGGFIPILMARWSHWDAYAPAYFIAVVAVISLAAMLCLPVADEDLAG